MFLLEILEQSEQKRVGFTCRLQTIKCDNPHKVCSTVPWPVLLAGGIFIGVLVPLLYLTACSASFPACLSPCPVVADTS